MKRTKRKASPKASIIAVTAASMALTACDYIESHLHDPSDDQPVQASSSSNKPRSSASILPYDSFQTWYGYEGLERIETGFDTGTETSGYWFEYSDDADGGASRIIWPVPKGNEYSDDSMYPIIEACSGLCGTYSLNKGTLTYHPFVGVGFNLAGETSGIDATPAAADASSMGGVCITYTSELAPTLQMTLGDDVDASIGYAYPAINLPKSKTGITKQIAWSDFKQPAWYKGSVKYTGEAAAKHLVSLRFLLQGPESTGFFNITAIGPYGGCTNATIPVNPPQPIDPPDPIDPPNPIDPQDPPPNNFETWFGYDGNPQINTGYGNETETYGYWYSFGDDMDGGRSNIVWPVEPGNDYSADAMDPIIVHCNGLCGTAVLDKGELTYNPYVGVGFNLVGETSMTDFTPATADASAMGGICITYTSTAAPVLEMGLGEDLDAAIGYAQPAAYLPKSTVGTTKFIPWSSFKQPTWYKGTTTFSGEEAAKHLANIRFKIQATPGEYFFNIQAIGPYNGGTCKGAAPVLP